MIVRWLLPLAFLLAAAAPPDDPLVDQQWHLSHIGAFDAWEASRGEGVVIAVLDTGVAAHHPDLAGKIGTGVDLIDRGTVPDDPNGHGTLVAGVIAAVAGNGLGGAGVAPEAEIMPVRVLAEDGRGSGSILAEGIRWAARQGADIINLSLAEAPGSRTGTAALITLEVELAIRDAASRGVLVVAAAGNEGRDRNPYRRGLPVLVVGATDRNDELWPGSNHDDDVLLAPGVDIVGPYLDGDYAQADGTSFATPIVSAAAALLMAQGFDADGAWQRLEETAVDIGIGAGLVDLAAALGVPRTPSETPTPTASPTPLPRIPVAEPTPTLSAQDRPGEESVPSPTPEVAAGPTDEPVAEAGSDEGAVPVDQEDTASQALGSDAPAPPMPAWPIAVASGLLAATMAGIVAASGRRRSL